MKKHVRYAVLLLGVLLMVFSMTTVSSAKLEWEMLQDIPLTDDPRDIVISADGATAYILCSKSVQVYSMREKKVTESIPLKEDFSQIALAPNGEQLFLTKTSGKQLSVIQISQVYDIPIGTSPVIGKATAPVTIFAFLDYQ